MLYCPHCHANVEGLLYRCDCCGESLETTPVFFHWNTFVTEKSGDFPTYVARIFHTLEQMDMKQYSNILTQVRFVFYCYPDSLIQSRNLKNSCRYFSNKKTAQIILVYSEEAFSAAQDLKLQIIIDSLKTGLMTLAERMKNKKTSDYGLIAVIIEKLMTNL